MPYDPLVMSDWQIAEEAEKNMPEPHEWRERLNLEKGEILPYGKVARLDHARILQRLANKPDGKYIQVTGITPTPLGEGKSTTTCGLLEGMGKRGLNVGGCIRQPSCGPTMNIKGTAAGGGNALLIPMTEFSMGLTGDINDITNAHNLAMVALTARMQHERNYDDRKLLALSNMKRLDIDPTRVEMGWVMDFCAQSLRNIIIGIGGKMDGFTMQSKFQIAVSSELMALLAIVKDLADLRHRMDRITVAYNKHGDRVTTGDLQVGGAMTALMRNTLNPTLCCTAEYQPLMVHTGPFANISLGQSSIIADKIGLKIFDYHVTESGFAADIGFEKFCNVKCRLSDLKPNCSVIVATIRALKMHGGGPTIVPGLRIPDEYTREDLDLLEKGIPNMLHHIKIVQEAGVRPVVCINVFHTDTKEEINMVKRAAEQAGARCAVSRHWEFGGEGALELADVVKEACDEDNEFKFLYPPEMKIRDRVDKIAREIYGADGATWSLHAEARARALENDPEYDDYATIMVKTPLSLSHDPSLKGVPKGWVLPIQDVMVYSGARFLCFFAGEVNLMPGTGSNPAFRRIDIDPHTGKVHGIS